MRAEWGNDEGITSFKLFMAYPGVFYSDDGQVLRAMQTAAKNGSVIMMHAENGIAIDVLVAQALARGETAPRYHGLTRPWETEEEATHRAIMLAHLTETPLYIVHMSAKQAVATLAAARGEGWNVFGETCPQYLYLSLEEHLSAPGFDGAGYVCSTPLRARAEGHQDELWRYLRTGDLSVVSTDHCPFCMKEQKELGRGDFSKIPNGLPGVEDRYTLLWDGGVAAGHISPMRFVELIATAPARMFGLHPRKGTLAPGSDADIVVFNPSARRTLSAATHHMRVDYSCYEGRSVCGVPEVVLQRGNVLVRDGKFHGTQGAGRFLERSRFGPGQGGSIDANVERWSRQFEGTPKPTRSLKKVNGLQLTLVQLAGTYMAPGGPMMQSQGKKPDYRLLAAIVEAPEGLIFLKLTGPAATVAAAQADFDALLASLAKT
jgi:dihydropyrimidinase